MKRLRTGLVITSLVVAAIASLFGDRALIAAEDEVAKYEKSLSNAKKELEAYRKGLLNSPAISAIKKEMEGIAASSKAKDKELAALLDSMLNSNPAYMDLESKAKEAGNIESELRKYRAAIEGSSEIVSLKKEATDLRARAQAREQEMRRIFDARFTADQKVKDLIGRKEIAAKAQREAAELKKNVMNVPQVKALNAELAELKKKLTEKNSQLPRTTENILKTDVRLKSLELRITELNKKIGELRKAQRSRGAIAKPPTQPAARQATQPKESLIDRIKRKLGKK